MGYSPQGCKELEITEHLSTGKYHVNRDGEQGLTPESVLVHCDPCFLPALLRDNH